MEAERINASYALGRVFGLMSAACKELNRPANAAAACVRPLEGLGKAMQLLPPGRQPQYLFTQIRELLDVVPETYTHDYITLEEQGKWWMGYYSVTEANELGIVKRRKALGWTQAQLAEKLGCTAVDVCRWETGAVIPKKERVEQINNVLSEEEERRETRKHGGDGNAV